MKQAAWRSWVFSTAWLCGSIWWLYISMHTYGGLHPLLAAFAVLLLSGCMALFYVLVCMVFHQIITKIEAKTAVADVLYGYTAIIFAACWMLAEMARGTWLTGFPWGAIGYAHVDGPFASLAPYIGVYGMSFVTAFASVLLMQLAKSILRKPNNPVIFQSAALAAMLLVLPKLEVPWLPSQVAASTPIQVTLLQGNIPQNEKFQAGSGVATALSWYAEQLEKVQTGLVVTPETAIPLLPQSLPQDYWLNLQKPFTAPDSQKAALVGIPLGDGNAGFSNSVIGFKAAPRLLSAPYRYDKDHLVPFGEFIPPFAQWFIKMMNIPLGTFKNGGSAQAPFKWQGQRLGLNICYEDLFGEELAQRFIAADIAPTVLVNLTNIAWFGNTIAIDQHLNIARLRSMELARATIRATNTGATAIIDSQGKVTQSLVRHTRGVLAGQVQGNAGITPYAWWASRFWLWPLWIFGSGILLLGVWCSRRK